MEEVDEKKSAWAGFEAIEKQQQDEMKIEKEKESSIFMAKMREEE